MSAESFAALRRSAGKDLADLAEEHFKHDLTETDRQALTTAASTISTSAAIGSVAGLTLGALLAFRLRRARLATFTAIRASERPTHVQFSNGRTEPIPDMTPYMRPTILGDVATYTFFGAGGLFLFGELGAAIGAYRARGMVTGDPETKRRVETAFRRFRVDVLKKEIEQLEKGDPESGKGIMGGLLG